MKVIDVMKLHGTEREVDCPQGGFKSVRFLLKEDGMGFAMTRTTIHPTKHYQHWHYKHHLEACYCIKGHGRLKDENGKVYEIKPGVCYALDKHDNHYFKADETMILLCVFNPPLTGREVHRDDGSYAPGEINE
jgi:L-ectoine synthase